MTVRHGTGRRWLTRWIDHDGEERTEAFARQGDAKRKAKDITAELVTGTYADPRRSAETFGTVAEEWYLTKSTRAPKTIGGYRGLLDNIILPKWRDVKLRDIDYAGMQAWVTWLSVSPEARQRAKGDGGLSPARVIQAHQVVHQVLAYAIRAKYIAANPAEHMQLPRKAAPKETVLTHEQVRQLVAAAGDLGTMVQTLASAGLRYGECVALRVRDVDIEHRRLKVSRSITGVRGQGQVEGETKTHQSRRVPILTQALADALAFAIQGRDGAEFLFPGPDGTHMTIGWFRHRFDRACAEVGLENVTPHTLRHTAGSLALASGASVVTVSKLLGHSNVSTTANIYSHMMPDDFENLALAMEAASKG
jgi:integrase